MKTNSIQQEVLLISGTSFLSRQLTQDEDAEPPKESAGYNQLEEACWNGIVQLMLPEIFQSPLGNKDLFMWKVTGLDRLIGMELGNIPAKKKIQLSIDPVSFLVDIVLS